MTASREGVVTGAPFKRIVRFEKGYNYLNETGPGRRGQHGMDIRFVLVGPHGASQFLMNTSWTPLGQVDAGVDREPCHVDYWRTSGSYRSGTVTPPTGFDLGYHWRTPLYEDQTRMDNCDYLGGAPCYYDGSGLVADDVLKDFISHGEPGVWRWLVKRYRWCLESQAATA